MIDNKLLGSDMRLLDMIASMPEIPKGVAVNVRKNGDKALFEYCEKFDKAKLSALLVSEEEIDEAYDSVEEEFKEIMKKAAERKYIIILPL